MGASGAAPQLPGGAVTMFFPDPTMYPTADGWTPPTFPSNEAMLQWKEQMDSLPKKTLVKRFILVRENQMQNLSDPHLMNTNGFSLKCIPLAPWSNYSGQGESRTWMVWV